MSWLKHVFQVQRKLAPFTLAMGLVVPAAAHEPIVESTVRTPPAASSRLSGGQSLLSAVHRFPRSKFGSADRPVVGIRLPSRISLQRLPATLSKPAKWTGLSRNETAAESAQATPPAPAPAPAEDSVAPQADSQANQPNAEAADAAVPSLEIAAAPEAQPQIPEVQPVAPGTESPAAGIELPW